MKFIILASIFLSSFTMLSAQCYPDRHSTNWFDGWVSCESELLPNNSQEKGHWIMYDFGQSYKLGQMSIWNTNDPSHLDWGMRNVRIEVSEDGIEWTSAGEFEFQQASGLSTYEGFAGPDLEGVQGRYVLIVGLSNWGGECFGLSEIRIQAEEVIISSVEDLSGKECFSISASPNPFAVDADIEVHSKCAGAFDYAVVDVLGRIVHSGQHGNASGTFNLNLDMTSLPQGTYYLRVQQNDKTAQLTLVKFARR